PLTTHSSWRSASRSAGARTTCRDRVCRLAKLHAPGDRVTCPETSPRRLGGERPVVLQCDGVGRIRDAVRVAIDHQLDLATGELDAGARGILGHELTGTRRRRPAAGSG